MLPQLASQQDAFLLLLGLGLMFALLIFLWLATYSAAVTAAGDALRDPMTRRTLEGLAGAVVIGLGLRLAAEKRTPTGNLPLI